MSPHDDYPDDMNPFPTLDDAGIEAMLSDESGVHPGLAAFIADVRLATSGPVPAPSEALAAIFANGVPELEPDVAPARTSRSGRRRVARLAGMSIGAKLAWGVGIAAAAAGGAGSAGVLPDSLQHRFAETFDGVLPFDVDDPEDDQSSSAATEVGAPQPRIVPTASPTTTTTSTTIPTTTTVPRSVPPPSVVPSVPEPVETTPTVPAPAPSVPTPTTPPVEPPPPATTTTTLPGGPEIETLDLACAQHWVTGARCEWSHSVHEGPVIYFLLKDGPDGSETIRIYGENPDSYIDIHTEPPHTYSYRLEARLADSTVVGRSGTVTVTMT